MVREVQQAVEHHDGERNLKRHPEQFGHQRNRRQVHGAHEQALEIVWKLDLVVDKR
jgi:uncharacterized membrane protein